MNVGMLVWSFVPEPEGGAERQCRLLVDALHVKGIQPIVLASQAFRQRDGSGLVGNVDVRRFGWLCPLEKWLRTRVTAWMERERRGLRPFASAIGFWGLVPVVWVSRWSFLLGLMWYGWRCRKHVPVDVLHVHESGWLAGIGVGLGRFWKIPVLCKEATSPALGAIPYGMPLRGQAQSWRMKATGWIAQTLAVAEQLQAAGINQDHVYRLPNGVVLPDVQALTRSGNTVLYVGNLTQGSAWKAFDVLFDAWIKVVQKRPSVTLVFVGAGDAEPWKRFIVNAGIADTVRFTGLVSDPSCYYADAGVFVLPSRIEGMSNALLEAQSWGCACVVSDIPGNTAVVQHDVNGLVVSVDDASALAGAIVQLFDDKALRQRLGNAARLNMIENYGISSVTERVVDIYQRQCAGTKA